MYASFLNPALPKIKNSFFLGTAVLCFVLISGCLSTVTSRFADNLSYAIINNNDLETVKAGGPAYLLMIDSLLYEDPENESLLRAAANLYTAYVDFYVNDKKRAKKLTDKALKYSLHAICQNCSTACNLKQCNFEVFTNTINKLDQDTLPYLYTLSTSWAAWIQAHRKDWNAVAEISRVEAIMKHVLKLNELYMEGGAHLYLGVLATLLPPALGGKPEEGRKHFERAIEISQGKNLMIKVAYAKQYARMVFDRDLHDRLLQAVLGANPNIEGYALINVLAQKQAKELLESAEEYF